VARTADAEELKIEAAVGLDLLFVVHAVLVNIFERDVTIG